MSDNLIQAIKNDAIILSGPNDLDFLIHKDPSCKIRIVR
jgi:hypothetical protein